LPAQRSSVLLHCAEVTEKHREKIVDWLVRETGST
jgi:acyl-CoA reductase-like NAD-dependent aldehyde dehydrogenase